MSGFIDEKKEQAEALARFNANHPNLRPPVDDFPVLIPGPLPGRLRDAWEVLRGRATAVTVTPLTTPRRGRA